MPDKDNIIAETATVATRRRENTSAFDYRVPPGMVAMTFDIEGMPPSTAAINVYALVDAVNCVDQEVVAGKTYEQVLSLFLVGFRQAKAGNVGAYNVCLLGYWLALNHPRSGPEIRALVSAAIAASNRVHITFYAARSGRGIAFAVAPGFVDLETAVAAALPDDA